MTFKKLPELGVANLVGAQRVEPGNRSCLVVALAFSVKVGAAAGPLFGAFDLGGLTYQLGGLARPLSPPPPS